MTASTVSREMAAALRILDGPLARKAAGHIDPAGNTIQFEAIADQCFSSTEEILCNAALDVWNGDGGTTVGDLAHRLDDGQLRAVLEAILTLRPAAAPGTVRRVECPQCGGVGHIGGLVVGDDIVDERCGRCHGRGVL